MLFSRCGLLSMHGERFDFFLNPSFSSFRCTHYAWQHVFPNLISNRVCVKHTCKDTISVKFCIDARGSGWGLISSKIWIASVSDSDTCWWEKMSEDGQNCSGYPRLQDWLLICPRSQSPQEHLYFDHPNLLLFVVSINTTMCLYLAQWSAPGLCIKKRGSSA